MKRNQPKYRFKVLKKKEKPLEEAQLYVESQRKGVYGSLAFDEISADEIKTNYSGNIYEISGERGLSLDEATRVINGFLSLASAVKYKQKGVEFMLKSE